MSRQNYVQIFKRRRDGKTDYRKRRGLIQGREPFLAVRVSNKYVYGQIMQPALNGDLTLCESSSRSLSKKYGWKGSAKNLPSAYLTGYLLGKLAEHKKIAGARVYSGLSRFVHGSRIAAFLGGAKDAGLELQFDEKILPDAKRFQGNHISEYGKRLREENPARYGEIFSKIVSQGLKPEEYPDHFERVKESIERKSSPKK